MNEKRTLTKEKIIEITAELVNKKGIQATSISDILKATGLTKGGLYFHFPNKESIIMSVLERAKIQLYDFLNNSLIGDSPEKQLNNFFEKVLERQRQRKFIGGCIFGNVSLEMSDKNNNYSEFVQDVFNGWINKLKIIIEEGQKKAQINKILSPENLAQFIVATIEGGIMLSRLKKDEEPLKDCIESIKNFIFTDNTPDFN